MLNHPYSFGILIRALIQAHLCAKTWQIVSVLRLRKNIPVLANLCEKLLSVDTGRVILSCLGSSAIPVSDIHFIMVSTILY